MQDIRSAPGISLKYTQSLPQQHALFRDGDNRFVFYHFNSPAETQFATHSVSYSGYRLIPNPQDVLIIASNGGLAIACAMASGANNIRIAAVNPGLARAIENHYHLPVFKQTPRAYLAQSNDRFQIIQVEDWGASLAGSDALNQHHLFTIDAFEQYINHLTAEGILIISRRLQLPPANTIRMWATAYEGLKKSGIQNPGDHLAVLRNWDTFTLLVSASPMKNPIKLAKSALDLNFDIVYLPRFNREGVNRFNVYDKPYHFLEIDHLAKSYAQGKESAYFSKYLLDVHPQSDSRPFPGRFLKWRNLKALYETTGSRLYALFMSGEVVVSAVFVQALLISIALLFIPQASILKAWPGPAVFQVFFFSGIGAGFMFVEFFFIKRFVVLFGDPVISITVVLGVLMVFSGLGGLYAHFRKFSSVRRCLVFLIAALVVTAAGSHFLIGHILAYAQPWRVLCTIVILMPAAIAMGMPFPMGMRMLLTGPAQRSYAWSVNGCASVLASIGSAQIALSLGIPHIMGIAILAYMVALFSVPNQA